LKGRIIPNGKPPAIYRFIKKDGNSLLYGSSSKPGMNKGGLMSGTGKVIEQLREWVEEETKKFEDMGINHFKGRDWCEISREEEVVFELTPAMMPRLVSVLEAYEAIAGIAHNDFYGTKLCNEARKALDWIEPGQRPADVFIKFAGLFGVPIRYAYAFLTKLEMHEMRTGIIKFADENDGQKAAFDDHPIDHCPF
jgi:hypothetical protein